MILKGRSLIIVFILIFIVFLFIFNIFTALILSVIFIGVFFYLGHKKEKLFKDKFKEQLQDGLDLICESLRSGMTFQQSIAYLIKEMPEPISKEFKTVMDKIILGAGVHTALFELAQKHKDEDLQLLASAVNITREAGGNLAEVLKNVTAGMREKARLEKQIETLTAQGKLSGFIVGVLPVILVTIIYFIDRELVLPIFTTISGLLLFFVALALELIGTYFIMKIVKIDY